MATAVKQQENYILVLTLSQDEAEALKALLGRCHYQGAVSSIFEALQKAKVDSLKYSVDGIGGAPRVYKRNDRA